MGKNTKPADPAEKKDAERLRKSLLSLGVDKNSVSKLVGSRSLNRIVIPVYWKDGLVLHAHSLRLWSLPGFMKSFEKEFPDGELRWDPDYDEHNLQDNVGEVALRVFFNYQEDDQGDHWSPRPTLIEEQSYQRMLKRSSFKGSDPVQAQTVLHGK